MNKQASLLVTSLVTSIAFACLVAAPADAGGGGDKGSAITVGACTGASYPTIQQGVNAASPGGTVYVCPGTYPEQVEITKNLNVIGTAVGNAGAAVIVPPVTGLSYNATNLVAPSVEIAASVWVYNAAKVNIQNLTVDDNNNGITGCTGDLLAGVLYQNSSGVLNEVATRNQTLPGNPLCRSGIGVFVQSLAPGYSYVSILNSSFHDYQQTGIIANEAGTNVTIYRDAIRGLGPIAGPAQKGIQFAFGSTGSIYDTSLIDHVWADTDGSDFGFGVLIFAAPGVNIGNNTVANDQIGIGSESDPGVGLSDGGGISGNTIFGTVLYDGIDLCSSHHTVSQNTISDSDESGIFLDDQCDPSGSHNYVSGNTINEACAGLLIGPTATGNVIGYNSIFNSVYLESYSDSCSGLEDVLAAVASVASGDVANPHTGSPIR
jgi:parallel beta-helix repeat protein